MVWGFINVFGLYLKMKLGLNLNSNQCYQIDGFQVIKYLELILLVRIALFYSAYFKLLHVVFWSITKINQDNYRAYVLIVICGLGMLVISQNYFLIQSEDSSSQSYVYNFLVLHSILSPLYNCCYFYYWT